MKFHWYKERNKILELIEKRNKEIKDDSVKKNKDNPTK